MNRYTTLLDSLGATTKPGADPAALAHAEEVLAVRLPEEIRELYRTTDGLVIPDLSLEFEPLSKIEGYAGVLTKGFGYFPFTDCGDSNPYAICCDEPLTGFVVHLYHDDEPVLACRSLGRFLDLLVERRKQMLATDEEEREDLDVGIDRLEDDLAFDRPERSAEDARVGRELVRHAEGLNPRDVDRGVALKFAAQMFGPGHEDELARVLALGDEYARESVLNRWRGLGTPAAGTLLRRDAEEFDRFVAGLAGAVEAAGFEVRRRPDRPHAWTVEPGNIWPNLKVLYAGRNDPGNLAGWLERVRRLQWQNATDDPLEKLARSGLVQWWVERCGGQWDHNGWQEFLSNATQRFGPLPADRVGLLLEEEKTRYWEGRRAAGQSNAAS
jgi:hypothetical protein